MKYTDISILQSEYLVRYITYTLGYENTCRELYSGYI